MLTRFAWLGSALLFFVSLSACGGGGGGKQVQQDAAVVDLSSDQSSNPCELSGGSCVTVDQCGVGQGYLSALGGEVGCGSDVGNVVCCYSSCGGTPTEFGCCSAATVFRPVCDPSSKSLECMAGTTQCTADM